MVRRIGDVLDLIDRAEIGERPQRLQVAGTWRQVLAGLDVRRSVEGSEAPEVRTLAADVGRLDQDARTDVALKSGGPLLDVRSTRVGIEAVELPEPSGGSLRKSVSRAN